MHNPRKPFFKGPSVFIFIVAIMWLIPVNSDGQDGYLHTEGTQIVNANGENVILRGSGLGGWMLQEGYMLQTADFAGTQYKIKNHIEDLIGTEGMEAFYDAWLNNYCTKADIDSLAAWGFNSVRLPMHYNLFTRPIEDEPVPGEDTWREKGFRMVDNLLEWCTDNEIYLILDLHAAPGGQGKNADISDYNPNKPSLWESEENQRKTIALWRKLANRYKNKPWIGGFDLINEPNWDFEDSGNKNGCNCEENEPLWDLYKRLITAIREVNQNHIIFLGGNCWGNNYNGLPDISEWDDNLVISFHKYWNYNTKESIQWALDMREERNIPIWLGESGENSNTWFNNAISLLERNNIGWAWWPYKKIESPTCNVTAPKTEGYQKILNYWHGEAEKPSAEKARDWLMEQAEMLKLENCTINYDVLDAKIRQVQNGKSPIPYKQHKIPGKIYAVDYDMGANGHAWHDTDTANYRTDTDENIDWNKGRIYRNDGVDIKECEDEDTNGYCVSWTEAGEWMIYTVEVEKNGTYDLKLRYAAEDDDGAFQLKVNEDSKTAEETLPATGYPDKRSTYNVEGIELNKGKNRVKLVIKKGGFDINYMK
ncbi:MAG: cellulase family glycosylhydrolase, partial [Marinilabiliaceae bacterium]